MSSGTIYILMNPTLKGLLKIGKTTKTAEERAAELSRGTGVPRPFYVAYDEWTEDCDKAERIIHNRLNEYRYDDKREFFELAFKDAVKVVIAIIEEVDEEAIRLERNTHENPPGRENYTNSPTFSRSLSGLDNSWSAGAVGTFSTRCANCSKAFKVTILRNERVAICPHCGVATSINR